MEAKQVAKDAERIQEYEGDLAALDNEIEELEAEKERVRNRGAACFQPLTHSLHSRTHARATASD